MSDVRQLRRLRLLLHHESEVERARALAGLGELGAGARPALQDMLVALDDPEPCVRATLLRSLVRLHEAGVDVCPAVQEGRSLELAWLREQLEARGVPLVHGPEP